VDARGLRPLTVVALVATTIAWLLSIVFSLTGHVSQGLVLLGLAAVAMAVAWLSTTRRDEPAPKAAGPKRTIVVRNVVAAPAPQPQPSEPVAGVEETEAEKAAAEEAEADETEPDETQADETEPEEPAAEAAESEAESEPAVDPNEQYAPH
jgi:hypothetical protein